MIEFSFPKQKFSLPQLALNGCSIWEWCFGGWGTLVCFANKRESM